MRKTLLGDTFPALETLLAANRQVAITLGRNTVYCMDNEYFRYLAAIKHGVQYDEDEDKIFRASWNKAR